MKNILYISVLFCILFAFFYAEAKTVFFEPKGAIVMIKGHDGLTLNIDTVTVIEDNKGSLEFYGLQNELIDYYPTSQVGFSIIEILKNKPKPEVWKCVPQKWD